MRSGELAAVTGVDVETIRYYEREGLLPAPPRDANGYRAFDEAAVRRLTFIRHCRALDIGLADIRRLLEVSDQPLANCGDINLLIDRQLERVRSRLDSLHALERQLQALRSACCGEHRVQECGILNELSAVRRERTTED